MSLVKKIALVTGASRGIGRAIALTLGKLGMQVIGTATSDQGAQSIIDAFLEADIKGSAYALNVSDSVSIECFLKKVIHSFGPPLILVNNAATTRDHLLLGMKPDQWTEIIETNLSSIFYLSKMVLRPMLKARWGRIINIASVVATMGNAGQVNYCAAKAGVIGFTKAMAQEVATRGITVNAVSPGFIDTDMTRQLNEKYRQSLCDKIPMNRMGKPEDIANAVAFLSSDNASYVTGQTLHVNGGLCMV